LFKSILLLLCSALLCTATLCCYYLSLSLVLRCLLCVLGSW